MKKVWILALALILTASLLTACRDNSKPMEESTLPSTEPATMPTVIPDTQPERPSTEATMPSESTDNGNGPMEYNGNGSNGGNGGNSSANGNGGSGTTQENNSTSSTVESRSRSSMGGK